MANYTEEQLDIYDIERRNGSKRRDAGVFRSGYDFGPAEVRWQQRSVEWTHSSSQSYTACADSVCPVDIGLSVDPAPTAGSPEMERGGGLCSNDGRGSGTSPARRGARWLL